MEPIFSPQFMAICRTQLDLLAVGLGAEWGVVYLAKDVEIGREPQLEPLLSFPEEGELPEVTEPFKALAGVGDSKMERSMFSFQQSSALKSPEKLFQPLVYEGAMLGLLMAVRSDRPWTTAEHSQIERMGDTLAMALALDRDRQWQVNALHDRALFQQRQQKILHNLLHQLRNPLTAIYTFGKLLLKRLPLEDPNRRIADNIMRESEHLKELLQQLDDSIDPPTAMVLSGSSLPLLPPASLEIHPCDVAEILQPLLASGAAVAQEKQLTFAVTIPADLPRALASASALREVLGNLIDNALKYTLAGGVAVALSSAGGKLLIAVIDSGLGIPATDLPRLFQRSYRGAQAEGNIPGTGLGLSIAKELLEQMGGSIQVASPSSQGSGSEFRVTLPLA
jgi:signal transduction histidine kinase